MAAYCGLSGGPRSVVAVCAGANGRDGARPSIWLEPLPIAIPKTYKRLFCVSSGGPRSVVAVYCGLTGGPRSVVAVCAGANGRDAARPSITGISLRPER